MSNETESDSQRNIWVPETGGPVFWLQSMRSPCEMSIALHVLWLLGLATSQEVDLQHRVDGLVQRLFDVVPCLKAKPLVGDFMKCCRSIEETCWPQKANRTSSIQACCQQLGNNLLSETDALMQEEHFQASAKLALSLKDKFGIPTEKVLQIVQQAMLKHKYAVHARAIKALNWTRLAQHHFGMETETSFKTAQTLGSV